MTFQIDTHTYDKAARFPVGHGYEARHGLPTSGVNHSTSGPTPNTAFASEAIYLYESADVSAHYLIGKDGACVQFLDPERWAAWHAGTSQPPWSNQRSIGVELHHSVGDPPYPAAQLDALALLWSELMRKFGIGSVSIETHGQVALPGPYKRKIDPLGWPHRDFVQWRLQLPLPPPLPAPHVYRVRGVPVYQRPDLSGPLAGWLTDGDLVAIDKTYSNNAGHLKSGLGFIDLSAVEEPQ